MVFFARSFEAFNPDLGLRGHSGKVSGRGSGDGLDCVDRHSEHHFLDVSTTGSPGWRAKHASRETEVVHSWLPVAFDDIVEPTARPAHDDLVHVAPEQCLRQLLVLESISIKL